VHFFSGVLSDIDHLHHEGKGSKATLSAFTVTISLAFGHPREADMGLEIWGEITTEYNGRAIKGSYKFLDGVVTVERCAGPRQPKCAVKLPSKQPRLCYANWRAMEWLKIRAQLIETKAIRRFNTT
jgi:hypothetical protein